MKFDNQKSQINQFNKSINSAESKRLFLAFSLILLTTYFLAPSYGIPHALLITSLFWVVICYRVIHAVLQPKRIIVNDDDIVIDNYSYRWELIKETSFDKVYKSWWGNKGLGPLYYLALPIQVIKFNFVDQTVLEIYPRLYSNNKQMRNLIEQMVRKSDVAVNVNDR